MSEYTEGPWKTEILGGYKWIYASETPGQIGICKLPIPEGDLAEHKANAQLIATAPELLEALEIAREAMTNKYYNKPKRDMKEEYKIVEQAISKAKGELNE